MKKLIALLVAATFSLTAVLPASAAPADDSLAMVPAPKVVKHKKAKKIKKAKYKRAKAPMHKRAKAPVHKRQRRH